MPKAKTKKATSPEILEGLNKEQISAVTHEAGPLLIVAGAGTGKTTVITKKIAWLIQEKKVKPEEILALTFTDKAANEMLERVDKLLPYGYVNVEISTFHSFCEQVLRDHGLDIGLPADFKLLDETAQWLLIRQNLDLFELDYYRPLGNPTKFIHALLKHFSRAKDEEIFPEDYLKHAESRRLNLDSPEFVGTRDEEELEVTRLLEVAKAYHVYQQLLYKTGALDFGDLIVQALHLLRKRPNVLKKYQNKFKYVLVDEFQDTNFAQYDLVKLLASPENNLTVVADDDQSIYKFRGASFSNILKFQQDFPDAANVFLVENYRSAQNILDLSYQFIKANNPDRLEVQLATRSTSSGSAKGKSLSKKLKAARPGEGTIEQLHFADQYLEAEGVLNKIQEIMIKDPEVTFNDFAILSRSHDALTPFIEALEKKQLPYIYFANKGLYRKSIVLDILSYFKLLDNYHENEALYRVLNFPSFKIDHWAIIEISHYAKRKSLSLYEVLKIAPTLPSIDQRSLAGINKLLQVLDNHCRLVKDKSSEEVFVRILDDLEFKKNLTLQMNHDPQKAIQNARFLDTFHHKIQEFCRVSADKSLKAFMRQVSFEQEAGEEGGLEFDPDSGPEAIKLMTVHGAKGLEFDYVFVVSLVDKRFPTIERSEAIEIPEALVKDILPAGDVHLQEERRLFYVAMTRARKGLYLTRASDYGGKLTKKPSRFLIELGMAAEEKSKPTGETNFQVKIPAVTLPVPQSFSFTQISKFLQCPLEYKYSYVLMLPSAGAGSMSFGQTVHKTFEKFMLLVKARAASQDLFGAADKPFSLPKFEVLKELYENCWIDDWFDNKDDMEEYRTRGLTMLRDFYAECEANPPKPKFVEESFELNLGGFKFKGKIDRADETPEGLVIIDYKTGASRKIAKVDKEQLMVYQLAAQEYFKAKVVDLQYWYLKEGLVKDSFLGSSEDLAKLREELQSGIEQIVECIKKNDFYNQDLRISHDCKYRDLEKGQQQYLDVFLTAEDGGVGESPLAQ